MLQSVIVPSPTAPLFGGSLASSAPPAPAPDPADSADSDPDRDPDLALVTSFLLEACSFPRSLPDLDHDGEGPCRPGRNTWSSVLPAVWRALSSLARARARPGGPGGEAAAAPRPEPDNRSSSPASAPSPPPAVAAEAARRVLSFLKEDLARDFLLRHAVALSAQNRARQRRWTVKMLLPVPSPPPSMGGTFPEEEKEGTMTRLRRRRRRRRRSSSSSSRGDGSVEDALTPAWEQVWPHLVRRELDDAPNSAPLLPIHHLLRIGQRGGVPDLVLTAVRVRSARYALEAHLSGFEPSVAVFSRPLGTTSSSSDRPRRRREEEERKGARRGEREEDEEVEEEEVRCQAWWVAERVAREILVREIGHRAAPPPPLPPSSSSSSSFDGDDDDGGKGGGGGGGGEAVVAELEAIVTLSRSSRKVRVFFFSFLLVSAFAFFQRCRPGS